MSLTTAGAHRITVNSRKRARNERENNSSQFALLPAGSGRGGEDVAGDSSEAM